MLTTSDNNPRKYVSGVLLSLHGAGPHHSFLQEQNEAGACVDRIV